MKDIPNDTIVSCIDLSKNLHSKCKMKCKICTSSIFKSVFWSTSHTKSTLSLVQEIFKVIEVWRKFTIHQWWQDSWFFICSTTIGFALGFLKSQRCFPEHHVVWSNGCSAQFKCVRAWYYVARYPRLTICELEGPKGGPNVLELLCIWSLQGRSWWCRCIYETQNSYGTN